MKTTKRNRPVAADPLNLPALKKRYDKLTAEIDSIVREQALMIKASADGLQYSEQKALRALLAVKGVLPQEEEPPYWKEWNDKLREQNAKLTAELAEVRAKLAEHEGKEQRLDLVRRLIGLDDNDVRLVRAALDSIERFHGCNTPAEEFVRDMLHDYSRGPLTPQDVEQSFEHFREDYNDMIADAKAFLAMHPDFAKETAGA